MVRASVASALAVAANMAAANASAMQGFADYCFSPFLTAQKAANRLGAPGVRVEFYDLDPFSNAAPSPVTGRVATDGTDRRCEVAFDGDHAAAAVEAAIGGLDAEGITMPADVPVTHQPIPGTKLLAARQLNPKRTAVVHVGTRPGPNGIETFMNVERLTPSEPKQ